MAFAGVKISVGQDMGGGTFGSSVTMATSPDIATILTDITAALDIADGSHDSTPEITTVQDDATGLTDAIDADVVLLWNTTTVTTRNQIRKALRDALQSIDGGAGSLSE